MHVSMDMKTSFAAQKAFESSLSKLASVALLPISVLAIGLFSASVALALPSATEPSSVQPSADTGISVAALGKTPKHDLADDNWFFLLSAGIGRPNYDSSTQTKIDAQKAAGGSSDEAGFADLPAIYRKVSPTVAVGALLSMSFENVSGNWHDERSFAIQTYHPSISAMYFPQGKFGSGWLARADLGSTRIYERLSVSDSSGNRTVTESNEDGYHALLGVGYGFSASSVARCLVAINGLYGVAGPYQINGVSLNIGFLL